MVMLPKLRFRLRTLLVVCTVLCVLLALYVLPAYRQRQAAAVLSARGALVYYEDELNEQRTSPHTIIVVGATSGRAPPRPLRWHQVWLQCDLVERAALVTCQDYIELSDAELALLRQLPHLEQVDLAWSEATDESLQHLQGLKQLRKLNLTGTRITDAGLKRLESLTALEELSLWHTAVTDAGLQHLRALKNLRFLELLDTGVDGDGDEIARLQSALPECVIWRPGVMEEINNGF